MTFQILGTKVKNCVQTEMSGYFKTTDKISIMKKILSEEIQNVVFTKGKGQSLKALGCQSMAGGKIHVCSEDIITLSDSQI